MEKKLAALNRYDRERSTSFGRSSINSKFYALGNATERHLPRTNSIEKEDPDNIDFGLLANNVRQISQDSNPEK